MIIYLTSLNKDKIPCCNNIKKIFKNVEIKCIESNSRIKGGQPYSLKETKQACINRTYQFKNNDNFISIENGFVRFNNNLWYDIAFIYIRINNKYYENWSTKRYFPPLIYNDLDKLINYFNKNSISREKQLDDCMKELITKCNITHTTENS